MEITTTTINRNPGRRAAVNALAIVGFIALIIIGIGLAIYTAQNAPKIASKLSGAAVSLSSIFHHNSDNASLQVVTATSTLPFSGDSTTATTSLSTATSSTSNTGSAGTKTGTGTAGPTKYITVTTTTTVAPYGDPDLTVTITDVGYLRTKNDTDTFVASNSVSSGRDGAVKFTVKNIGTNVTGDWKFQLTLPTSSSNSTFTSPTQDSLKPGESVDYVLGFQHSRSGNDRAITVRVDSGKNVSESDEGNNYDSATIDLK
ncbi:MAG TPA: CARDB domain-containing protein [Candidatus Paceibacterota bacterium]|nr:CARDB domain-containing protein [Candidatus Paceibacterota bacterium]